MSDAVLIHCEISWIQSHQSGEKTNIFSNVGHWVDISRKGKKIYCQIPDIPRFPWNSRIYWNLLFVVARGTPLRATLPQCNTTRILFHGCWFERIGHAAGWRGTTANVRKWKWYRIVSVKFPMWILSLPLYQMRKAMNMLNNSLYFRHPSQGRLQEIRGAAIR